MRVDVLATNGGKSIQGLLADDFELRDNGVLQEVELLSLDHLPLNVILALDVSESVAGERFEQLNRASNALLGTLTTDDQSALVTFRQDVRLAAPLSSNHRAVGTALQDASGSGDTALRDALYAGLVVGEGDPGRALIIVFSDGVDTISWLSDDQIIDTVKRADAVIYAAAVRSKVKPELLEEVASLTGGRLHEIDRIQNLEGTFLDILNEFRNRYLLTYQPRGVTPGGWHELDVRIKGRRATVQARPGYLSSRP